MARAKIKINGTDTTIATVAIGSSVSIDNDNEGGEVSFAWSIIDQPEGTADTLSNATIQAPTFTPTKEGSYELRLVVNASLGTQTIQTAIVAVLDARSQERVPAATETTEASTTRGWAAAANRILIRALRAATEGGSIVVAQTPGGIAAGSIVNLQGIATINTGTQAVDKITAVTLAAASTAALVSSRLGVVVDGVVPGQLGAGKLITVRTFGIAPLLVTIGGTTTAGSAVYVSNAGLPSLTPGTTSRQIGRVVSFDGGTHQYQWSVDNVLPPAASALLPDGDYGDVVVSGSGAVLTVDAGVISNTKLAVMPALTIKGNPTGSSAAPADMTASQTLTVLGLPTIRVIGKGDGRDGAPVMDGTNTFTWATLAGSTYTLNRTVFFTSPTLNSGITLKPDGWPIYWNGTFTNNGDVNVNGGNASGVTNGSLAVIGSKFLPVSGSIGNASNVAPQVFPLSSANNHGIAGSGAGGAGHDAAATNTGFRGGGGGGEGVNFNNTSGGNAGGPSPVVGALSPINNGDVGSREIAIAGRNNASTPFSLGTCGGAGGGTGGGAGTSGGWMGLYGYAVAGSGTWRAIGGNGGNAPAPAPTAQGGGGGGGGAGGFAVVELAVGTVTVDVTGGTGGSGGGASGGGGSGGAGGAGGAGYQLNL